MGPPSYVRSVVDRNVIMRRITVFCMNNIQKPVGQYKLTGHARQQIFLLTLSNLIISYTWIKITLMFIKSCPSDTKQLSFSVPHAVYFSFPPERQLSGKNYYDVSKHPLGRGSPPPPTPCIPTILTRGTDKSLARPGRKQARKHVRGVRDFNNIETRAVTKFFFSARQGAEGNSRHSDRNISLFPSWLG